MKKTFLVMIFSACVLLRSGPVFAADQAIMTLDEVEALIDRSQNYEVEAYFKSVERGVELKTYNVILRGIYSEPGLKVIMFVTHNKIVAGMSGSPMYVDGKLIGALAYGFNSFAGSNYWWGGTSPISEMMREADSSSARPGGRSGNFTYRGMAFEPIPLGHQSIDSLGSFPESQVLVGDKFIIASGSAGNVSTKLSGGRNLLRAGMPIVVDLMEWTDEKGETTTVSAMGTITYVDKAGRLFAFGHPFLNTRKVIYGFRAAEVMGTVYSEASSFKLTGKRSEVLGAITMDAAYGIYGLIGSPELNNLHRFHLEFKNNGQALHSFDIKVADSIMTSVLAQYAFGVIGEASGAPLDQELSVTNLESRVEIEDRKPIVWNGLFASRTMQFGPSVIYTSSYKLAMESFFNSIHGTVSNSRYGLKISHVSISANFILGSSRVLKVGAYRFPNKVIYGQDPVLEVLFVGQDNLIAIAKKLLVRIDWSKVEKPIYTRNTLDTEKDSDKVVGGMMSIRSGAVFLSQLTTGEKQALAPEYFLGADDFLENLSRGLEVNNQKIFVRVALQSRSGLFDEEMARAEDIMPEGLPENDSGWQVIEGGLKSRKKTLKNDGRIIVYLDLPPIPDGYVVDQRMNEGLVFEVVLEGNRPIH